MVSDSRFAVAYCQLYTDAGNVLARAVVGAVDVRVKAAAHAMKSHAPSVRVAREADQLGEEAWRERLAYKQR